MLCHFCFRKLLPKPGFRLCPNSPLTSLRLENRVGNAQMPVSRGVCSCTHVLRKHSP